MRVPPLKDEACETCPLVPKQVQYKKVSNMGVGTVVLTTWQCFYYKFPFSVKISQGRGVDLLPIAYEEARRNVEAGLGHGQGDFLPQPGGWQQAGAQGGMELCQGQV